MNLADPHFQDLTRYLSQGRLIVFFESYGGEDTIFHKKILSYLGSCQQKLPQIASQSFSEDNEKSNGLAVKIWLGLWS